MGFQVYDETKMRLWGGIWVGPGGAVTWSLDSAGGNGVRFDAITGRNPDSIDHLISIGFNLFGDVYLIGDAILPAGCGVGAVAPVDLLAQVAAPGIGAILLIPDSYLVLILRDAIVDTVDLNVAIMGGQF